MSSRRQPGADSASFRRATTRPRTAGMTMLELLIVLSVLAVLAMIVTPLLSDRTSAASDSRWIATEVTMKAAREAISDYYADHFEGLPYPADSARTQHPQLAYLYVNPVTFTSTSIGDDQWNYDPHTERGWSGPYLSPGGVYTTDTLTGVDAGFDELYGEAGDPCPIDGWGNPIVIQQPQPLGSTASMHDRTYTRLVSAGPNGLVDTPPDVLVPTDAEINDDIVLYLLRGT